MAAYETSNAHPPLFNETPMAMASWGFHFL